MRKVFTALIFSLLVTVSYAAEVPRANLDEAERFFHNAYIHFM